MPFDGILTHFMAKELTEMLGGGRIGKIYQVGKDTVTMQIRANGENHRLLVSSNAASPRIHLSDKQYENPDNPPVFCMLLRKHISGALIRRIYTNDFERIVIMEVEATDELGDRSIKKLIVEIMGRYSNIILLNKDDKIIDAIKHVDREINRVRELLPARNYVLPPAQDKLDPTQEDLITILQKKATESERKVTSFLLDMLQGFSPVLCREVCQRAGVDEAKPANDLSGNELSRISGNLENMMNDLVSNGPSPMIVIDESTGKFLDFHAVALTQYSSRKRFDTISQAVDAFYQARKTSETNSQRTLELVKAMEKHIEKCEKRLAFNVQSFEENTDYDRFRLYGELITSNIYSLEKGLDQAHLLNYYADGEEYMDIPLNKDKNPQDNAQYYYKRYYKSRSAFNYAKGQLVTLKSELSYLESVMFSIENAEDNNQLQDIRQELYEQGYLHTSPTKGKRAAEIKSSFLSVVSSDGFEIFIGRNNKQNDKLTLKTARHEDLWFHIKNFPGSHVIIKTEGREVPEKTLHEAAGYAAWFSKARSAPKVEVDYTHIRNVKKPSGAKPGMVIYVNYNTIMAIPKAPEGK